MKHTRTVYIYLFLSLTIPTLFSSCRKESDTLIQPSEEQVLQANSKAVELLSKVTANPGKKDNIIDSSSLISIVLPVSVDVEGDIYIINNQDDIESTFFIGPSAGGVKVDHQDLVFSLITPSAPLGKAMIGQQLGDEFELNLAGKKQQYEIIDVQ